MTIRNNAKRSIMAITIMMVFTAIFFGSCKKDKNNTPPPTPSNTVVGVYTGKQSLGPNDEANFKFELKSNGVFEEIGTNSGIILGKGTWQAIGNNVTATYAMVEDPTSKYSIAGTYNPANSKLNGTWGFDNDAADGGTIQMAK